MKKFAVIFTVIVSIISIYLGVYIYQKVQEQLEIQAKCPPTVTGIKSIPFEITIKALVKGIPEGASHLDLWMPYPQNKKSQIITNVAIKSPYPVEVNYEPQYGNAIMYLGVEDPKADFEVEMKISAVREESVSVRFIEEHSQPFSDIGDFSLYLKADEAGKASSDLDALARQAAGDKKLPIDRASAIYTYMMDAYEKDLKDQFLPGAGRCAELNTLYAAFLRTEKIPVRFINGYAFKDIDEGKLDAYGCRS